MDSEPAQVSVVCVCLCSSWTVRHARVGLYERSLTRVGMHALSDFNTSWHARSLTRRINTAD